MGYSCHQFHSKKNWKISHLSNPRMSTLICPHAYHRRKSDKHTAIERNVKNENQKYAADHPTKRRRTCWKIKHEKHDRDRDNVAGVVNGTRIQNQHKNINGH